MSEIIEHTESEGSARLMSLDELFAEAATYGFLSIRHHSISTSSGPIFAAAIHRNVGQGTLKTQSHWEIDPRKALLGAVLEAKDWGLPLLEIGYE